VIVGTGGNGLYTISLGLQQSFGAAGVFLNPLGITNAASLAPATSPIAPQEILLLSGNNLAPSAASATGFPLPITKLNGVTLLINGQKAPLISVSPSLITAVVPRSIAPDYDELRYATFQVMNNGTPSNAVTMFVSATSPGVFALAGDGIGPAAIRHGLNDTQIVDADHPATTNEVVEIFVNGLGGVTPGVPDGEAALPYPGLSKSDAAVQVYINNIKSPSVQFSGLAPGYAGLGQINAVVPAGTGSGNWSLTIATPGAVTLQTTINVRDTGAVATTDHRPPDQVSTRR
jgi:adhesin/invasin